MTSTSAPPPGHSPTAASPGPAAAVPLFSPSSQRPRIGTPLPRDIVAWLQSLALPKPIKYPQKDLTNGCVVAQICARYWPHVPLHSIGNGAGIRSKQSNWFIVRKVMRQHDVDVSPAMVEGMISGDRACAEAFLSQLYTIFTGRTSDTVAIPLPEEEQKETREEYAGLYGTPPTAAGRNGPINAGAFSMSGGGQQRAPPADHPMASDGRAGRVPTPSQASRAHATKSNGESRVTTPARSDRLLSASSAGRRSPGSTGANAGAGASGSRMDRLPAAMKAKPLFSPTHAAAMGLSSPEESRAAARGFRPNGIPANGGDITSASGGRGMGGASGYAPSNASEVGSTTGRTQPMALPPIVPPLPSRAVYSDAAVRSGKPVLDVAVHTAEHLSTVVGTGDGGDAGGRATPAEGGRGEDEDGLRSHGKSPTPDASTGGGAGFSHARDKSRVTSVDLSRAMSVAWFCAVAYESTPDHAQALLLDHSRSPSLPHTLTWLAGSSTSSSSHTTAGEEEEKMIRMQVRARAGVWQALTRQVPELAGAVLRHAGHGLDILFDRLFTAVASLPVAHTSPSNNGNSGNSRSDHGGTPSFEQSTARFCAALLSQLCHMEPQHGQHCFQVYVLASPPFARVLGRLHREAATDFALLLLSALPTQRGSLTRVLAATWTAVEELVRDAALEAELHSPSSTIHTQQDELRPVAAAEASLLVLLSALVQYLLHGRRSGGGVSSADGGRTSSASVHRSSQQGRVASTATSTSGGTLASGGGTTDIDALELGLLCIVRERTTAALTAATAVAQTFPGEATAMLEAALALQLEVLSLSPRGSSSAAVELLSGDVLTQWLEALFPISVSTTTMARASRGDGKGNTTQLSFLRSPTLSVLSTRWLRGCLQDLRVGSPLHLTPPTVSVATANNGEDVDALHRALAMVYQTLRTATPSAATASGLSSDRKAVVLMAAAVAEVLQSSVMGSTGVHGVGGNEAQTPIKATTTAVTTVEEAAQSVMHVLLHIATPAQTHALLHWGSPALIPVDTSSVTITHPFLDSIEPQGPLLPRSDTLPLVQAVLHLLKTKKSSGTTPPPPSPGPGAGPGETDAAAAARRLGAQATLLAREGHLEESLASRVHWLHALIVDGRPRDVGNAAAGSGASAAAAAALADRGARTPLLLQPSSPLSSSSSGSHSTNNNTSVVAAWRGVVVECWDDLMLVLQASSIRLRQRGAAVSASSTDVAALTVALGAAMLCAAHEAEEVVCVLYRELSPYLPGHDQWREKDSLSATTMGGVGGGSAVEGRRSSGPTLNPAVLSNLATPFTSHTAAEELQAVVRWMWTVVGGAT